MNENSARITLAAIYLSEQGRLQAPKLIRSHSATLRDAMVSRGREARVKFCPCLALPKNNIHHSALWQNALSL